MRWFRVDENWFSACHAFLATIGESNLFATVFGNFQFRLKEYGKAIALLLGR